MAGLLWICLILLLVLLGSGILALFYGKNIAYDITVSECCVLGLIVWIGLSEVVHVAGYFLNWSLQKCLVLWLVLLTVFALLMVLVSFVVLQKGFKTRVALCKGYKLEKNVIPFVFLGVLLFQLLFIFCTKPLLTEGDITLETVQSFLAQDGIYRVLPLTGQVSETGVPLRYGILCLPTIYAMLCKVFAMDAELLVCHGIPVVVAIIAYMGYYHLSGILFAKNDFKKRFLFLLTLSVVFLFTDTGVFSNGYGILHAGHLGTTIRNLILVPYLIGASLEGRWWKAFLCVLTEACIAWTFWGMGVSVAVMAGMLLLTTIEKKCSKLRNCLQIFRNKEDLT